MLHGESEVGRSVYRLIEAFNEEWLHGPHTSDLDPPHPVKVYFDGRLRPDGVDSLRILRPSRVRDITHLDPTRAATRFGAGHASGAILVSLGGHG